MNKLSLKDDVIIFENEGVATNLNVLEVYSVFIRKKGLQNLSYDSLEIEEELKSLTFKKSKHDLICRIIPNDSGTVSTKFLLRNILGEDIPVSTIELVNIEGNSYLIKGKKWLPISE